MHGRVRALSLGIATAGTKAKGGGGAQLDVRDDPFSGPHTHPAGTCMLFHLAICTHLVSICIDYGGGSIVFHI